MKVCIYGAGAIGGFLGVRLGAQGHEVCAVARGATLAALQKQGMRLRVGGAETRIPVTAADDARTLGAQDLVVVAVKEPAMRAVAAGIGPLLGPDTIVMTAMNGVSWWFFDGMPEPCAGLVLKTLDPEGAIASAIPVKVPSTTYLPYIVRCLLSPTLVRPIFVRSALTSM
jgi:2-dehydropantoate 2-reductase